MPTYSYRCTECSNAFDIHQAFTDDSLTVCPVCGAKLRKVFSAIGVTFNGSGFYRTDSRAQDKSSSSGDSGKSSSESGKSSADSGKSGSSSDKPSSGSEKTGPPAAKPSTPAPSKPSTSSTPRTSSSGS